MIASIAADMRWAYEQDRTIAAEPGRRGLEARFEREVDPEGVLAPQERAKRVANVKRAYYVRLALLSAEARRRRG